MEATQAARKYSTGYKTMTASEIGSHVRVYHSVSKNMDILPSTKLIYAYIRSYMDNVTKTSSLSIEDIISKSGYSNVTVVKAIKSLVCIGAIKVEKKKWRKAIRGITHHEYRFLVDDNSFEMMTILFLESKLLTTKEKEFMIVILPYILPNDSIGSLNSPITYGYMSVSTGLSENTIVARIKSMAMKGLISVNATPSGVVYSYTFSMRAIMLSGSQAIVEDRNNYRKSLLENGILTKI